MENRLTDEQIWECIVIGYDDCEADTDEVETEPSELPYDSEVFIEAQYAYEFGMNASINDLGIDKNELEYYCEQVREDCGLE